MKTPPTLLAVVLAATVSSLCLAQQPPPPTAQSPSRPSSSVGDHLVKELAFNQTPLDDVLRSLESECPGFQAVIVHDPRFPDFNPVVDMSLKNLPLSQILEVIGKSLPELRVDKVSSNKGDVWIFRIQRSNYGQPTSNVTAQPTVMVYRLTPLIRANAADRSKALNDILSLVQAALEAMGSNQPSLMKVHAATETLIFRGFPNQLEAVNRTLRALEPTPDETARSRELDQARNKTTSLYGEMDQLQRSLEQARKEAADARQRMLQQTEEIEKLQARLRSLEKSR